MGEGNIEFSAMMESSMTVTKAQQLIIGSHDPGSKLNKGYLFDTSQIFDEDLFYQDTSYKNNSIKKIIS